MKIVEQIEELYEKKNFSQEDAEIFEQFKALLNDGSIRAAEYNNGKWQTNRWVKKGILLGFRMGKNVEMKWSDGKIFYDKHTYPEKTFENHHAIRIVPGGTSVRDGSYIGINVTIMPPAFVNTGAFVDEGTMIDSHALVGSCAQIGKRVHLSAAAIIGGVLEPIGSNPVIIEDDVFIGGNTGIYEGVIVKKRAIIAAGVVLTASTKVYDNVKQEFISANNDTPLIIPENAVLISGTRQIADSPGISVYCPVIIKYRDAKTDKSVALEASLRI